MAVSAKSRLFAIRTGGLDPSRTTPVGPLRAGLGPLAHLIGMTESQQVPPLERVLTTSQLAAHLGVPSQTIHDLRHAGRGPRGFRVGRELRYRVSEVEQWLARLEDQDGATDQGGRA